MRTLTAEHTAEQKLLTYDGIWKIVLTKAGEDTQTYTNAEILDIDHPEEPYDQHAEVKIDNSGGALTALDLKGYQAVISYGHTTSANGDEYSPTAPLTVLSMKFDSAEDTLVCIIECIGTPNLMAEDRASQAYIPTTDDPKTVKDLINEIAAGTASSPFVGDAAWAGTTAYSVDDDVKRTDSDEYRYTCITPGTSAGGEPTWPAVIGATVDDGTVTWQCMGSPVAAYGDCPTYTVTWDSEDSLIDAYTPKDGFRIYLNGSRLAALRRLLDWTKCVMRFEDDGEIHIFLPTTTGTSYDYEYALSGEHTFFAKTHRKRLVIPNRITVETAEDAPTPYTGSATDADSYAALGNVYKTQYEQTWLSGNAQAASIAEAILSKYQMHAETGAADAPMEVATELFDYVKVTDSRQSDSRVGNIGRIRRRVHYDRRSQRITEYSIQFQFGGWLSIRKLMNDLETQPSGFGSAGQYFNRLFVKDLYAENIHADNLDFVWLDPDNTIDLSQIGDTLDNLADGVTYARVLSAHLDAGQLKLDATVLWAAGYDPTDKFDLGAHDLDDVPEGTSYKRVLSTHVTAGKILLTSDTQVSGFTLDQVGDGATYQRVLATQINAGSIELTSTGFLLDEDGVIAGTLDTTSTQLTADGLRGYSSSVLQVEVKSSDGSLYCAAGAIVLNAAGINIDGQLLIFKTGATIKGYLFYRTADARLVLIAVNTTDLHLSASTGKDIIVDDNIYPTSNQIYTLGYNSKHYLGIYSYYYYFFATGATSPSVSMHMAVTHFTVSLGLLGLDISSGSFMVLPTRDTNPTGSEGRMYYKGNTFDLMLYANSAWQTLHDY